MGKFTAYKVELASLKDGRHTQEFEIGTKFFENMENFEIQHADVKVHLDLEKRNDAYDCRFHCVGKLQVPCDRCLDPIDIDVDTEYHVVVKYGESYDDGADNLLVIPYSNTYLNAAYMLYDTLVLSVPLRHVHPLGKCNRAVADALRKHRSTRDDALEDADGDEGQEGED